MAQPKGQTGNPKGRPPGTLNKTTAMFRAVVAGLLTDMLPQIEKDIESISDPVIRIQLFERLLSYTLPKPQQMQFPIDDGLEIKHIGNKPTVVVREQIPENVSDSEIDEFINNLNSKDYE
jgi:hypothetical protein